MGALDDVTQKVKGSVQDAAGKFQRKTICGLMPGLSQTAHEETT